MRRREFIAALGGAVASPLVARAQAMKSYRLGYLALLPGEDTTLAKPLLQPSTQIQRPPYHSALIPRTSARFFKLLTSI
jgi:hypothetical protein